MEANNQISFETREDFQVPHFAKTYHLGEIATCSGIRSHLFYLKLQHCNVSLSFNKIQLTIVLI
jgi:hypothetical protein